jgi:predicted O-methyltransferase YrrM
MPLDLHPETGLGQPTVSGTLRRLHADARRDRWVFARAAPSVVLGALIGRSVFHSAEPYLTSAYIPVSEEFGRLLYIAARGAGARNIVEFGSSFGISSIYLAAAAQANDGRFTGTELNESKCRTALENIAAAGLSRWADIREGDALESLAPLEGPVDFVFLDGWKDLYIPVLKLLEPKLAPGAIIMADNLKTFPKTLKPFRDYICAPANGYESVVLEMGSGVSFSTRAGR